MKQKLNLEWDKDWKYSLLSKGDNSSDTMIFSSVSCGDGAWVYATCEIMQIRVDTQTWCDFSSSSEGETVNLMLL